MKKKIFIIIINPILTLHDIFHHFAKFIKTQLLSFLLFFAVYNFFKLEIISYNPITIINM